MMTPHEVAERLRIRVELLYKWKHAGRGPRWIKLGGRYLRYRSSDVEAWLEHEAQTSGYWR